MNTQVIDKCRWPLMATIMLPLASCVAAQSERSATTAAASPAPAAVEARSAQTTAQSPPPRSARRLIRSDMGGQYCLVRAVDDGRGGSTTSQLPIVGVPNAKEWVTNEDVKLEPIEPDPGNCGPTVAKLPGNRMSIKRGTDDNHFEVSLLSVTTPGDTTVIASATFSRPNASEHYQPDAFLYSRKKDVSGSSNGGIFGQNDFYLYVVDVARSARSDVSKLVLVEWFDPGDPRSACHAERPETAMKRRDDVPVCELPAWLPYSYGWPSDIHPAPKRVDMPTRKHQTGTGGGYEPPG